MSRFLVGLIKYCCQKTMTIIGLKQITDTQTGKTYTVEAFKEAFPNLIKRP